MLTKILFTLIVVVGIVLYIRIKKNPPPARREPEAEPGASPSTRTLIIVLIILMVAVSIGVFIYKWQMDHRIIQIRVTGESGETIQYEAHHKDVSGRSFVTLEGVQVTLGSGERMETIGY